MPDEGEHDSGATVRRGEQGDDQGGRACFSVTGRRTRSTDHSAHPSDTGHPRFRTRTGFRTGTSGPTTADDGPSVAVVPGLSMR